MIVSLDSSIRQMADACTPTNVPDGIDLVAYYVDGRCAAPPVKGSVHVGISSMGTDAGVVGDCEPGNPPPSFWVGWVQRRRAAGVDPTIYCAADSESDFFSGFRQRDVIAAFDAAGVPQPHYWLTLPGAKAVPAGAVAVQYALGVDNDRYDLSLVADFWPGVDMADLDLSQPNTQRLDARIADIWNTVINLRRMGSDYTAVVGGGQPNYIDAPQGWPNSALAGLLGAEQTAEAQVLTAIGNLKTALGQLQVPPADLQPALDALARIEKAMQGA